MTSEQAYPDAAQAPSQWSNTLKMPFCVLPEVVGVSCTGLPGGSNMLHAVKPAPQVMPAGLLVTLPPPLTETLRRIHPATAVAIFEVPEQPLESHA
jgi:hypothetical protein